MTGLNIEEDKIMEVACLITDSNLNVIAEGPDIIIHQPENILHNMTEWCVKQHKKVRDVNLNMYFICKYLLDWTDTGLFSIPSNSRKSRIYIA